MKAKKCLYCRGEFISSRYHPKQRVCTSRDCQRHRRKDAVYREQCRDSQSKWLERHPTYMKKYMAQRRSRQASRTPALKPPQLEELLHLEKNNLALDLKTYSAKIWLLAPDAKFEKNILASAQLIVIQALIATPARANGAKRTSL